MDELEVELRSRLVGLGKDEGWLVHPWYSMERMSVLALS